MGVFLLVSLHVHHLPPHTHTPSLSPPGTDTPFIIILPSLFTLSYPDALARSMRLMPPTNYSVSAYKAMLSHAVSANHNMLRVWGGGKFLPSVFYDECDKLGVMVYQDVMYGRPWFGGNGSIPLADSSMQHMEVTHNIRRLSAHPCIVVWCAGNEYDGKKKKNDRSIDRLCVCLLASSPSSLSSLSS